MGEDNRLTQEEEKLERIYNWIIKNYPDSSFTIDQQGFSFRENEKIIEEFPNWSIYEEIDDFFEHEILGLNWEVTSSTYKLIELILEKVNEYINKRLRYKNDNIEENEVVLEYLRQNLLDNIFLDANKLDYGAFHFLLNVLCSKNILTSYSDGIDHPGNITELGRVYLDYLRLKQSKK